MDCRTEAGAARDKRVIRRKQQDPGVSYGSARSLFPLSCEELLAELVKALFGTLETWLGMAQVPVKQIEFISKLGKVSLKPTEVLDGLLGALLDLHSFES